MLFKAGEYWLIGAGNPPITGQRADTEYRARTCDISRCCGPDRHGGSTSETSHNSAQSQYNQGVCGTYLTLVCLCADRGALAAWPERAAEPAAKPLISRAVMRIRRTVPPGTPVRRPLACRPGKAGTGLAAYVISL